MVTWAQFTKEAPYVSEVFSRRHAATGKLCMLGTIKADGSPRVSPMEPNVVEGQLVLVGMPGTSKFRDLTKDPRFELHTATIDTGVSEGDAKVSGVVENFPNAEFQGRFLEDLYATSGFDLRGQLFDPFFVANLTAGSCIELDTDRLKITIWKPGVGERIVHWT